jgi:acyl carrier protein
VDECRGSTTKIEGELMGWITKRIDTQFRIHVTDRKGKESKHLLLLCWEGPGFLQLNDTAEKYTTYLDEQLVNSASAMASLTSQLGYTVVCRLNSLPEPTWLTWHLAGGGVGKAFINAHLWSMDPAVADKDGDCKHSWGNIRKYLGIDYCQEEYCIELIPGGWHVRPNETLNNWPYLDKGWLHPEEPSADEHGTEQDAVEYKRRDEEIIAKVISIVAGQMNVDKAEITRWTMINIPDQNSSAPDLFIELLLMEFDDAFDVAIDEDDAKKKIHTVGQAIDYIKEEMGKRH